MLAFYEAQRATDFGVTQKKMTPLLYVNGPILTLDKNNDILKVDSEFCNGFSKTFISKMSGVLASSIFAKKNCQKFLNWVVLPKRGRPLGRRSRVGFITFFIRKILASLRDAVFKKTIRDCSSTG